MPTKTSKSRPVETSPFTPDSRRPRSRASVAPPAFPSHLPKPVSASLSPTGVLSWEWMVAPGPGDLRRLSTMPLPRQVDARLCEFFIRLAEGEKERIRRFAARWGPLHYPRSDVVLPGTETETVDEW